MFDAQCDFAAVLYGVKDNPDRLLFDFTEDLRRSGVRTAGLVQLDSWTGQSDDRAVRTVVLSTREVIPVAHERNLAATGCGLDCVLAAIFNATVYGRAPTPPRLEAVRESLSPLTP